VRALLIAAVAGGILAPSSLRAAGAPFDLRALRAAHPGAGSVVLERETRISRPDADTMRLAVRSTRAVLDDVGSTALSLFSEVERPGCRHPGGVRIEVEAPSGETLITTMEDLVRLPTDPFAVWKGPRQGVATGALVHESFHVDYSLRCTGGVVTLQGTLGARVPVLEEIVLVDCDDCAVDVGGPGSAAFVREGDRRVLRAADVQPAPTESHRPDQTRPRWYVSTSSDPLAWGRVLADALPAETRRWSRLAGAWASWAREQGAGMGDRRAALLYGLSRARVLGRRAIWTHGVSWGEPVGPGTRPLRPLEWLAMTCAVLGPRGGTPVLFTDSRVEVVDGVAGVFDWDEVGVLVDDVGLVSTGGWAPLVEGGSGALSGSTLMTLRSSPQLVPLTATPEARARAIDVTIEPSGISSVLVSVTVRETSSWATGQAERWERMQQSAKRRRRDLGEAAREFASGAFFDGRRLAATTVDRSEPHTLTVSTAWTEKDAILAGDGYALLPVNAWGIPDWLAGIGEERELPMDLGARALSGTVTVRLPDSHALDGLPEPVRIDGGPITYEAVWAVRAGAPTLQWSLRIERDVLDPGLGPVVAAVGAAARDALRAQLVLVPR
jgi:hypothetical protein